MTLDPCVGDGVGGNFHLHVASIDDHSPAPPCESISSPSSWREEAKKIKRGRITGRRIDAGVEIIEYHWDKTKILKSQPSSVKSGFKDCPKGATQFKHSSNIRQWRTCNTCGWPTTMPTFARCREKHAHSRRPRHMLSVMHNGRNWTGDALYLQTWRKQRFNGGMPDIWQVTVLCLYSSLFQYSGLLLNIK